jgi:hypothetical protein
MTDLLDAVESCVEADGTSGFLAACRYAFCPALLVRPGFVRDRTPLEAALSGTAAARLAGLATK